MLQVIIYGALVGTAITMIIWTLAKQGLKLLK
jgi:hypothetical protein